MTDEPGLRAAFEILRLAIGKHTTTVYPADMDERLHLPIWHVPDSAFGDLRRALDASRAALTPAASDGSLDVERTPDLRARIEALEPYVCGEHGDIRLLDRDEVLNAIEGRPHPHR